MNQSNSGFSISMFGFAVIAGACLLFFALCCTFAGMWLPVSPKFIAESQKSQHIDSKVGSRFEGWIRIRCYVYEKKSTAEPIGLLSKSSSVGVVVDNDGWLRLLHGPITNWRTGEFINELDFDSGLFIKTDRFTTDPPMHWNK